MIFRFEVEHIEQLDDVAEALVSLKKLANVFAFFGPMGAGKTTLIKRVCLKLGIIDEVNSPTYSIVNEYVNENNISVYHFDFYRIKKLEEAFDIGYENYFYSTDLCLVEWPEKILQLLPQNFVKIIISVDPETEMRLIEIETIIAQ